MTVGILRDGTLSADCISGPLLLQARGSPSEPFGSEVFSNHRLPHVSGQPKFLNRSGQIGMGWKEGASFLGWRIYEERRILGYHECHVKRWVLLEWNILKNNLQRRLCLMTLSYVYYLNLVGAR